MDLIVVIPLRRLQRKRRDVPEGIAFHNLLTSCSRDVHIEHPKVVYLREAKVLDEVDGWLAAAFGPHSLGLAIAAMTERMIDPDEAPLLDLWERLSKCDRKLSQYGSALDAAGDLIEIFSWINRPRTKAPAWRRS